MNSPESVPRNEAGHRGRGVVVFTGTRADFGLLRPVVAAMHDTCDVPVELLVSGSHLAAKFGTTVAEVRASGLPILAEVALDVSEDSNAAISGIAGEAISAFSPVLGHADPMLGLVLGDRYEALAFATTCLLQRIPLAHVHGGETTAGAVDDQIRNAITQMSELHLVAAEMFGDRVISMGANPANVHVVGAPGLDAVRRVLTNTLDHRSVVEALVGQLLPGPVITLAFHPQSKSNLDQQAAVSMILDELLAVEDATILCSAPNADWNRMGVDQVLRDAAATQPDRVRYVTSFGHEAWISALAISDVVVGNSSSSVIEAPFVGTPSILVGDRQRGRPLAASIIEVAVSRLELRSAIRSVTDSGRLTEAAAGFYGDGYASSKITAVVQEFLRRS